MIFTERHRPVRRKERHEQRTPYYAGGRRRYCVQSAGKHAGMVKKIGKTTYKVHVHFSNTSTETMSDKIKRMLKNEIQQM